MPELIGTFPDSTSRSSVKVIKQRVEGSTFQPHAEDFLAIEDPLEVVLIAKDEKRVSESTLLVTMRTPGQDSELIHGLLYCEGVIQSAEDIVGIELIRKTPDASPVRALVELRPGLAVKGTSKQRSYAMHSSCGTCGTGQLEQLEIPRALQIQDSVKVSAEWIHTLPRQMQNEQDTFRQTGGLHASALFSADGKLQASHEDIGRHNALDKVIGASLIAGSIPSSGQTLCVSGRMSYEILQKALMARIPIIAGVGAPSSLAVTLAEDFGITLIGFLRNDSFNIYSCPERIC